LARHGSERAGYILDTTGHATDAGGPIPSRAGRNLNVVSHADSGDGRRSNVSTCAAGEAGATCLCLDSETAANKPTGLDRNRFDVSGSPTNDRRTAVPTPAPNEPGGLLGA
jgi:hypothetical protein